MGQRACKTCHSHIAERSVTIQDLPDLATLPPEVAVQVLSHLDATDLCLASCVNESWYSLANVEILWKGYVTVCHQINYKILIFHSLCTQKWGYTTAYRNRYMVGGPRTCSLSRVINCL